MVFDCFCACGGIRLIQKINKVYCLFCVSGLYHSEIHFPPILGPILASILEPFWEQKPIENQCGHPRASDQANGPGTLVLGPSPRKARQPTNLYPELCRYSGGVWCVAGRLAGWPAGGWPALCINIYICMICICDMYMVMHMQAYTHMWVHLHFLSA